MALVRKLVWLLRNDPSAVAALLQAGLALAVARYAFSPAETAAVDAVGIAVLGLLAAAFTRPFHVQAVTGLLAALGTLVAAFSVHLSAGWVSILNAALAALLLLWRERKTQTVAEIERQAAQRQKRLVDPSRRPEPHGM